MTDSKIDKVELLGTTGEFRKREIPLFSYDVAAGFPSPAQDYVERSLDLNELCVQHPASTYFVRARGNSMTGVGIFPQDILVVDRALDARHNDIVIASVDGAFTVKQLQLGQTIQLVAASSDYAPIEIDSDNELEIFGVVTHVIHRFR